MSSGVSSSRRPRRVAGAAIAVLVGVLLSVTAAPAFAHDELLGADPAAGAQLEALPESLTLTFSGVLLDEPGATAVVVTDAAGISLTDGDPVLDGTSLTQPLSAETAGIVTVIWRVVSSDGHPISGEYTFTVGDGTASPVATPEAPTQNASGFDATWTLVGIAGAAIGALALWLVTRRRPPRED